VRWVYPGRNAFLAGRKNERMADDTEDNGESTPAEPESESTESDGDGEEKSFRERVEEIRQKRAEEGDGEEGREPPEEMMGGGPGGMGGGNPFAQMMGGMMGGGPGGMGGGPGGMGGPEGRGGPGGSDSDNEELIREMRKLRDEVHDMRRSLDRIADALED
jgi:hypothetical protein